MKTCLLLLNLLLANLLLTGMRPPNIPVPPAPAQLPVHATATMARLLEEEEACLALVREGNYDGAIQLLLSSKKGESADVRLNACKILYHYACKWRRSEGRQFSRGLGEFLRGELTEELDVSREPSRALAAPECRARLELLMEVCADVLGEPSHAADIAAHLDIGPEDLRVKKLHRHYSTQLKNEEMATEDDPRMAAIGVQRRSLQTTPRE